MDGCMSGSSQTRPIEFVQASHMLQAILARKRAAAAISHKDTGASASVDSAAGLPSPPSASASSSKCRRSLSPLSDVPNDSQLSLSDDDGGYSLANVQRLFSSTGGSPPELETHASCASVGSKGNNSFWAHVQWAAVAHRWDSLKTNPLVRGMRLDSACPGIGSELHSASSEQLGLPLEASSTWACEPKQECAKILADNNRNVLDHCWKSLSSHSAGSGYCFRHGRVCTDNERVCPIHQVWKPSFRKDIAVIGAPCQPYTRYKSTADTCKKPPLFEVMFGHGEGGLDKLEPGNSAFDLLRTALYSAVVIEQVDGFMRVDVSGEFVPVKRFLEKVFAIVDPFTGKQHYTHARLFHLSPEAWVEMSRSRSGRCLRTDNMFVCVPLDRAEEGGGRAEWGSDTDYVARRLELTWLQGFP